jgi:hypothetical protein
MDRLDFEREPFDFSDADARAFRDAGAGGRGSAPKFAVNEDHSSSVTRAQGFGDVGFLSDQFFFTGGLFPLARAKDETHQDNHDDAKRKRDTERRAEADPHSGDRRFNQENRAEDHGYEAADAEHAEIGRAHV